METVKKVKYRWVILAVYMLVTALCFMSWLTFASIETVAENRFNLSNDIVIWLTHVFILFSFLLSIPSGKLIDQWGYKKGVGIGVVLMGIFTLFRFLDTHSFTILLISQTGIAIGQPFIVNGVNKLTMNWFPHEEHATAIGLGMAAYVIGDAVALGLTPHLVTRFSFEFMLYAYSIATVIGSLLFFLLTKSPHTEEKMIGNPSTWSELKEMSKYRNFNLCIALYVISTAVIVYFLTYSEKMIHEIHQIPLTSIGNLSAIFMLCTLIGGSLIPILSDLVKNRKILLVIVVTLPAPALALLLYSPNFLLLALSTSAAGFFLAAIQPLLFTISAETVESKYAGVSVGYLQFLGNGGALVFIPLMGALRSLSGSFTLPLYVVIFTVVISVYAAIKVKDTY